MVKRNAFVIGFLCLVVLSAMPWSLINSGDTSDVIALPGDDQSDSQGITAKGTASINAEPWSSGAWTASLNPYFPNAPNQGYGIDSQGCWASHDWIAYYDPTDCIAGVQWKRTFSTPVNMRKYRITAASLTCVVSANVSQNVDTLYDDVHPFKFGDFVRFYVILSDVAGTKQYEVAYNQTTQLGLGDDYMGWSAMNNTYLVNVTETLLISYLTSVLEGDYTEFVITLGIFIFCEDNGWVYMTYQEGEQDTFTGVRINSFSLTYEYEKIGVMPAWLTWLLIGIIAGLIGLFIAYMSYFRVPRVIRKIRKTSKKISVGKTTGPLGLNDRNALVKDIQTAEMKLEERELQNYEPILTKIKKWFPQSKET